MKIVERAGGKIVDLLHKSNPWEDMDCQREKCLMCKTAMKEEGKLENCKKRCIVYEIHCVECGELETPIIEENREIEEKVGSMRKKKKNYKYVYIGETHKSGFERGKEHQEDKKYFNVRSHMLKHCILHHGGKDPLDVDFGMRLRGQFKTALERQVSEAVTISIEQRKGVHLMNSKSEFNRCPFPRINTGNQREVYEPLRREDEEDQKLKADIRCLKKRKKSDKKEEVTTEKVET